MARFKYSGDRAFKESLIELQGAFASRQFVDELKRMRRSRRSGGVRLMVKELREIKLRIDGDRRHARPHLHVDYGRNHRAASFAIDTCERLAGDFDSLDSKYDRVVREWIERNRELLMEAWEAITGGRDHLALVLQLRLAD